MLDELCRILKGTLLNCESKNLKLKNLAAYTLFPVLSAKAISILTPIESDLFLGILETSMAVDWGNKD